MRARRLTTLAPHIALRASILLGAAMLLTGCPSLTVAPFPEPIRPPKENPADTAGEATPSGQVEQGPAIVAAPRAVIERTTAAGIRDTLGKDLRGDPIRVSFNELPLAAFIHQVFGEELGMAYVIAPGLQGKADLVTLRLAEPVPPAQLFDTARGALREFGVDIRADANVLTFVLSDEIGTGEIPLLVSGRALPEVPATHRTIFQLVPLHVAGANDVRSWLNEIFDNYDIEIDSESGGNALLLSGKAEAIAQALAMIEVLDQPLLRGRQAALIEPRFLKAEDLAEELDQILRAQGYETRIGAGGGAAIFLPLGTSNRLAVFVNDRSALALIEEWTRVLDIRRKGEVQDGIFTYRVQNTQAEVLAQTLSQIVGTTGRGFGGMGPAGVGALDTADRATLAETPIQGVGSDVGTSFGGGGFVVDKNSNTLIFRGSGADWEKVLELVEQLDKPVPSVLIEVLIAEILLTDLRRSGFEFIARGMLDDYGARGGTVNSLGLKAGALSLVLESAGQTRALLNLFDEDSRVAIRSRPNLMVKSGESATIEVGNEIPTISQFSDSGTQVAGETNVLQSVEYRQTGINLQITPVVQANGLVDLQVSHTLSEARPTAATSLEGSPTILSRQISTSLTLRDGGSLLMGGLISNGQSTGEVGVPVLKDVPGVGRLFRAETFQQDSTE
ncbi:MAG: hypothetical protein OXM56_01175, partial [Gammaproteobacteria bacterium]|nr:hypothetical protein [Gammaproteobacteria bacterium]